MPVTYTPENLWAGFVMPRVTKSLVVKAGQGVLVRGSVLGLVTKAVGNIIADDGNTGDGTVTGVSLGKGVKIGSYTLECIAAVENGGTFKVVDPDGFRLGNEATVGQAYIGPINFTINDGDADFVSGDKFSITVIEGTGIAVLVDSSNVDGSEEAVCFLGEDIDASDADVTTTVFMTGEPNERALVFGGTDTVETHRLNLEDRGIYPKPTISA